MDVKNNPIIKAEFHPDLDGDLIPGICAAGIYIGSSGQELLKKIGLIEWYDSNRPYDYRTRNDYWVGIDQTNIFDTLPQKTKILSYKNGMVRVYFNADNDIVYNICVSEGYKGTFYGLTIGSDYAQLYEKFALGFEKVEELVFIKIFRNKNKDKKVVWTDQLDAYYFDEPVENSSIDELPAPSDEPDVLGIKFFISNINEDQSDRMYIHTMEISNWTLQSLPSGFFDK